MLQVLLNCRRSHTFEYITHLILHMLFLLPPEQDAHPLCTKGHNLPAPLVSLKILHGVILITKVLILPSCCVPFIRVPFSSQPDKLNLLQPDSPADFTACFVYSTSCFCLAEGGSDKWHESTAIGATMTTCSTSCRRYKLYVFQTGRLSRSATCKADYVRNKRVISDLPECSHTQ